MKLLQLGQLFALPIQSAIRAQNLALQETISLIEQFGLEEGVAKTFRFKAERMVEERTVDPKTGIAKTQFKAQPFEVNIPLLAIVSLSSMQLQEMNVELGVEIVEPRTEVIKSAVMPSAAIGSSSASSLCLFTTLGQSNPTTMKVNMKIVKEIPEGMARLGDVLADLLSGQTPAEKTPPTKTLPLVKNIHGIGLKTADILKAKGILTVKDFVFATEKGESIKELAKTLRVSEKRVREWREKAKLLIEEKE